MRPKKKNKARFRRGITLIEIMVSITALTVAVLGSSYFRYFAAMDARRADMNVAGTRLGLLLCESWKGLNGTDTYDAVVHLNSELEITYDSTISFSSHPMTAPLVAQGFTELGTYAVLVNGVTYYAVLSWKDVDIHLRALNVMILWEQRGWEVTNSTDASQFRSFKLTTYVSI